MGEFVNAYQSADERRRKYKQLKDAGAIPIQARKWRDFTAGCLERKVFPFLKKNAT